MGFPYHMLSRSLSMREKLAGCGLSGFEWTISRS